jgi:nicotinate-nucleotide pyrophosphorylase (carboxylating)
VIRKSKQLAVPAQAASRAVTRALAEDRAGADLTTRWTVPAGLRTHGYVEARQPGTIAGLAVFAEVYRQLDAQVRVRALVADGEQVTRGRRVVEICGPARSILTGERVALNFLQRLSGIATTAASYIACVADLPVKILDTRKTVPGLRELDKYAVACGGAANHRLDLSAMVLIKDNHLAAAGGVLPAVRAARRGLNAGHHPDTHIEVEVTTIDQARQALECKVDWILLDNMTVRQLAAVVGLRDAVPAYAGIRLEASGNVTLESVRSFALSGVDAISVGALTHSPRALDLSLRVESTAPVEVNDRARDDTRDDIGSSAAECAPFPAA